MRLLILLFMVNPIVVSQGKVKFIENKIIIDKKIMGIVTKPVEAKKYPVVLMLHGFASNKNEVGNLYLILARKLAQEEIASLRIDFRGWGESQGDMANTTIQGQVLDAQKAYNYLTKQSFTDTKKIGIIGFSLGGGIAIISAAKKASRYKSLVLWSCIGSFHRSFQRFLPQKQDILSLDLGWRKVRLKKSFFLSLSQYNIVKELKKYSGALLAIAGSKDYLAAYLPVFRKNTKAYPIKTVVIKNANHIYNVLKKDKKISDKLIEQTIKWFAKTLK